MEYIHNHSNHSGRPPFFLYLVWMPHFFPLLFCHLATIPQQAYTTPHAGSVGSVGEDGVPVPLTNESTYANETLWPVRVASPPTPCSITSHGLIGRRWSAISPRR